MAHLALWEQLGQHSSITLIDCQLPEHTLMENLQHSVYQLSQAMMHQNCCHSSWFETSVFWRGGGKKWHESFPFKLSNAASLWYVLLTVNNSTTLHVSTMQTVCYRWSVLSVLFYPFANNLFKPKRASWGEFGTATRIVYNQVQLIFEDTAFSTVIIPAELWKLPQEQDRDDRDIYRGVLSRVDSLSSWQREDPGW